MKASLLPLIAAAATFVHGVCASEGDFPDFSTITNLKGRSLSKRQANDAPSVDRTPGKLRMTENSGVCESPGVYQASGYADLAANQSMWFWYFDARNDPDTAPVSLWFGGGPGSASTSSVFNGVGPCRLSNDSTSVEFNPYSFTTNSNFIFIDQPIGVGFSHGDLLVNSTQSAAEDVWKFLQIFFSDPRFEYLAARPLAIWTQSYGGHYGPGFAKHFLDQNAKIADGSLEAITLNIQYLGMGSPIVDALIQYDTYPDYAKSNPYHQLVNDSVIATAEAYWDEPTHGCKSRFIDCYNSDTDLACSEAHIYCLSNITLPLIGDYNVYYVPHKEPDAYPPPATPYLNQSSITSAIGADSTFLQINQDVFFNFVLTGDHARNMRQTLEYVIDAGVKIVVWVGDADYVVNFNGVEDLMDALETKYSEEYRSAEYSDWTVDGQDAGYYKNAGNVSFVTIYGAGHSAHAYKHGNLAYGQASFQMFSQIMNNEGLSST